MKDTRQMPGKLPEIGAQAAPPEDTLPDAVRDGRIRALRSVPEQELLHRIFAEPDEPARDRR
ncbi:hypothetical protein [Streptomyces aidingensis]|uniref:Uncharacterized protein n=1 Tax=Streptomyces aidingensis TaxID=910347 RepID=A0A1I1VK58_9ACTN|nr:hypothetical protein [Streptomyces aidingensis]SFD81433.1 hypothetical protein SAMN05421773_1354 [Streptomyces aidingensis]